MSSLPDAALEVPHFVYRCYDATGVLLYVGVARNVEDRMYHHMHPCNIGKQPNGTLQRHMARYESELYPSKLAARTAERRAITNEAPLVNRQHNPSRFRKVNTATYGLTSPAHPISVAAFPTCPILTDQERAA